MSDLHEAALLAEEVSSAQEGETVGSVDLTTVSQQLDQVILLQQQQLSLIAVLIGVILGITVGKWIARLWS